jgi:O-antigen ligase
LTRTIARPSNSSGFFSIGLGFTLVAVISFYWCLYWVKQDLAILLFRPTVSALTFLFVILWYQRPSTMAERKLAAILATLCAILLVPSMVASDPARAITDWVKVTLLCALCLVWSRALRDEGTGNAVGKALLFGACVLTVLVLVVYVTSLGWVLPTYKATRVLKGITTTGIPLNAVPFAAILSYFSAFCFMPGSKPLYFLGVIICGVSTLFTGSRAPVAVVGASVLALALIAAIRSNKLAVRIWGIFCLLVCVTAATIVVRNAATRDIDKLSEGRLDLWSVAWQKFLEKPWIGNGFDSWDDDLVSRLPGEYKMTSVIAKNVQGGGYHNEYLTMLAEQGLAGTIPALYFFGFVFVTCWKLAFRRSSTWRYGSWPLFVCIVILARACVEVPGLFGYANEPSDYLCFLFVAIAVSRLSIEEDHLRWSMETAPQTVAPQARTAPRLAGFRSSDKGIAHIS